MPPEVTFMPDRKTVSVKPGTTLLHAAKMAKVTIRSRCGGNAGCLMCKVIVEDQSGLSVMQNKEELKLGDWKRRHYRLACQAKVVKSVIVTVPEDPLKAAVRAQLAKQQEEEE